ncbi:MAG: MGMT family protein [Pseudomonadota bacterium]
MRKIPSRHPALLLTVDTPFGLSGLAFRDNPFVLVEVILPGTGATARMEAYPPAGEVFATATATAPAQAHRFSAMLREYFSGEPVEPPWEFLDLSGVSPLARKVLAACSKIPWGQTASYGELAGRIGRPKAARFVGTALSQNPFPVFIPCHRVVRRDGSLGGFGGGVDLKERMLRLESASRAG